MRARKSVVALHLVAALAACTTIKPDAPPPVPAQATPSTRPSVVTVPINVDASAIATALNGLLPSENGSVYWTTGQDLGDSTTFQIGVHRDGNVSVTADGGCLNVSIPLKTNDGRVDKDITFGPPWARIHNRHHADIPDRHIDVRARACLGISSDWHITSSFQPDFSWAEDPVAEYHLPSPLPTIRVDIADRVNPRLRELLPRFTGVVQERLTNVPVRQYVEKAWNAMQTPMKVWDAPAVALEIEPISVGVGALTSSGNTVTVHSAVAAKARTILAIPNAGAPVHLLPLPNNVGVPADETFHLQVQAVAPFSDIDSNLHSLLVGKTLKYEGDREITISDAKVFGYGDKVGVRVDFSAKTSFWPVNNVSGWVYLVGKPKFDFAKRQVSVEELKFDARTSSLLVDAASVIAHPYFRAQLQKAMLVDVSRHVDPLVSKVRSGIAGYKVRTGILANVAVSDISATDITISKDGISVFLDAKGTANLMVENLALAQ
jgi:hypothetical protein